MDVVTGILIMSMGHSSCYITVLHHNYVGAVALQGGYFGSGSELTKVYFTNVTCTGHESSITGCEYVTPSTCPHSRDAGVRCLPGAGKLLLRGVH